MATESVRCHFHFWTTLINLWIITQMYWRPDGLSLVCRCCCCCTKCCSIVWFCFANRTGICQIMGANRAHFGGSQSSTKKLDFPELKTRRAQMLLEIYTSNNFFYKKEIWHRYPKCSLVTSTKIMIILKGSKWLLVSWPPVLSPPRRPRGHLYNLTVPLICSLVSGLRFCGSIIPR